MADGVTAVIRGISEAQAEFRRIDRSVDRATMYAVRQAGRVTKQTARRKVRVYTGPRTDIPKGRLKKAISSSRRLKGSNGVYAVTVGPRGFPAAAYGKKIEELDGFMAAGLDAAASQLRPIAEQAWVRATKGRR